MKQLLILLIVTVFISCKEEKKEENVMNDSTNDTETPNKVPDCSTNVTFQEFMEAVRDGNGTAWINENGSTLCNGELITCVEQSHRIYDNKFDEYVNAHQANASGAVYYSVKWQDIENKLTGIECYENYLSFKVTGGKLVMQQGAFSTNYTTYSAVFLRQVKRQHNLGPNDTISFVLAKVPAGSSTKESLIFKIDKSTSTQYYDMSDFPGDLPHYVVNPS